MTRAEILGLVRWVRVGPSGISGRCVALTAASARAALPCGPEEHVTSAASHAIGMPKALAATRCTSCGLRDRIAGYDLCAPCRNAHRQDVAAALRKERKAERKAARPPPTPEQVERRRVQMLEAKRRQRARATDAQRRYAARMTAAEKRAKLNAWRAAQRATVAA